MNVKFLNPFVEAAYEVLTAETRQEVTRGDLKLENGTYLTDDLTVILSLVGAVEGTVFYSMSAATGATWWTPTACSSCACGRPTWTFVA
uniref:Chemotaxis protein CheX n=1 Tax=Anaerolinea thermolimosa TaxID=229919 RepID=A0A7C4PND0_9CHLR